MEEPETLAHGTTYAMFMSIRSFPSSPLVDGMREANRSIRPHTPKQQKRGRGHGTWTEDGTSQHGYMSWPGALPTSCDCYGPRADLARRSRPQPESTRLGVRCRVNQGGGGQTRTNGPGAMARVPWETSRPARSHFSAATWALLRSRKRGNEDGLAAGDTPIFADPSNDPAVPPRPRWRYRWNLVACAACALLDAREGGEGLAEFAAAV